MSHRQNLPPELTQARQALQAAQMRVNELEAQLGDKPNAAALLANQDSYRILDSLLEGAEIIGFDWRYLYVNDASARHGRQVKEVLLRSTVLELYPGIENTSLFAGLRICMEERIPQHFENHLIFPDGELAWFELSVMPVPEGIFILSQDITQRKQADKDSKQYSENTEEMRRFLRTTLDAFPANTAVLNPDGTIVNVNLPWQRFADENDAGTPTHYLDTNYLTICDKAVEPEAQEAAAGIREVIAGQQDDFDMEYPCDSPTEKRWFMLRVTPFDEPAPRRVVIAHINITERKLAEKAEQEQRVIAETLRDSIAVLTTSLDVETVMQQILAYSEVIIPSEAGTIILFEGDEGRVAYVRGHAPEVEDYFKDHRMPLNAGKFATDYDHDGFYLIEDTRSDSDWITVPHTSWIRSSIGVPIILRGKSVGMLVVDSATPHQFQNKDAKNLQAFARYAALALENAQHFDQLEARVKERTAELQAAKERVEAIFDSSVDGTLLAKRNLSIQQTNPAFSRLFACEPDDYFNQPLTALLQEEDRDLIANQIQVDSDEEHLTNIETRARRRDGTWFDAELSIGFIHNDGLVCSIRDITERKQAEVALRQAFEAEKELGELKTRFVLMASHEFRTPLATILALTETLSIYRHKMTAADIEKRFVKIKEQIGHLKDIMDDVLLLARMQARRVEFNPVMLDIDAFFQSELEGVENSVDFSHHLQYSCGGEIRDMALDRKLIRRIIDNIVSNAIKYSPQNSSIAINLEFEQEALIMKVSDEGIGIPEADLKHLFEPFHRASNVGTISGTGLGLVITKEAVELHGGTIAVESQLDEGTVFTIRIPISASKGSNDGENSSD